MEEKVIKKINELKGLYDFYLEASDKKANENNLEVIEKRLHDLKLQIWILEDLLESED